MSTSFLAHTNHEKLPDELLAEIFLESNERRLSIPYNHRESIWVLPRVCSRWRRIAFGTRTLWSNLWLRDLDGRLRNVYTRMLKEALVRGGRALLSFHINQDIPEDLWYPVLAPHLGCVRGSRDPDSDHFSARYLQTLFLHWSNTRDGIWNCCRA